MTDYRNADGTFTAGNPGGPGRPPRATERAYLASMADSITLDDWRQIVARAVADAKAGDKSARDWLSRYLLGETPITLTELATREAAGVTPEEEIGALAKDDATPGFMKIGSHTLIELALDYRKEQAAQDAAALAAQDAERKREARRAARLAATAGGE
ncbi:MAG: hypothetical protein HZB53_20040 [Chloroflexi bacterium]|nr:hypothetical protein [Chloroflexota bacterium]